MDARFRKWYCKICCKILGGHVWPDRTRHHLRLNIPWAIERQVRQHLKRPCNIQEPRVRVNVRCELGVTVTHRSLGSAKGHPALAY